MADSWRNQKLPGWPRGVRVEWAAAYVGLTPSSVREAMARRDFPEPIRVWGKRIVWLREDLDAYLDRKAGRAPATEKEPGSEWMEA